MGSGEVLAPFNVGDGGGGGEVVADDAVAAAGGDGEGDGEADGDEEGDDAANELLPRGWGGPAAVWEGGRRGAFAADFAHVDEAEGAEGGENEEEDAQDEREEPEVEEAAGAVFGGVVGVVEDVDAFADFLNADVGSALFSAGVALAVEGEAVVGSGEVLAPFNVGDGGGGGEVVADDAVAAAGGDGEGDGKGGGDEEGDGAANDAADELLPRGWDVGVVVGFGARGGGAGGVVDDVLHAAHAGDVGEAVRPACSGASGMGRGDEDDVAAAVGLFVDGVVAEGPFAEPGAAEEAGIEEQAAAVGDGGDHVAAAPALDPGEGEAVESEQDEGDEEEDEEGSRDGRQVAVCRADGDDDGDGDAEEDQARDEAGDVAEQVQAGNGGGGPEEGFARGEGLLQALAGVAAEMVVDVGLFHGGGLRAEYSSFSPAVKEGGPVGHESVGGTSRLGARVGRGRGCALFGGGRC